MSLATADVSAHGSLEAAAANADNLAAHADSGATPGLIAIYRFSCDGA